MIGWAIATTLVLGASVALFSFAYNEGYTDAAEGKPNNPWRRTP